MMADQPSARQRARDARAKQLASRAAQDRRIEELVVGCYEAQDAIAAADVARKAAEVTLTERLGRLRTAESQTVAAIAGMTGLAEADVRRLLPARRSAAPAGAATAEPVAG